MTTTIDRLEKALNRQVRKFKNRGTPLNRLKANVRLAKIQMRIEDEKKKLHDKAE